jgi:hypothetical protein
MKAERTRMADTTYIVLRAIDGPEGDWLEYAKRDASSADAAIRKALETHPADGRFVAVPARSWKPVTVRTETTTTIRLDTPAPE